MIPKIIHVTWFGDDPFPPLVIRCMDSWKKCLTDYEIMIWTKDNYDLTVNTWVKEAYAAKKYAFVSDFARFELLYRFGGIYLDSDVEVLKSFDSLLHHKAFAGFMSIPDIVEAEVIGSEKNHPFFKKAIDYYSNRSFILDDGEYDTKKLPEILYSLLNSEEAICERHEQDICGVHLYPPGYFTYHMDFMKISDSFEKMYSYHYGAGLGWRKKTGILGKFFYSYLENGLSIVRITKRMHIFPLHRKLLVLVFGR